MGFTELGRRLRILEQGKLIEIFQDVLNSYSKEITELNKQQLEKGIKADESAMKLYSPKTVKVRQIEGNPVKGERIALFDTGDFWSKFWINAYNNELEFYSGDSKTEMLIQDYGESIFGLTTENFKKLGELIMPKVKERVQKFLAQ